MAPKRTLLVEGRDDEYVIKSFCGGRELVYIDRFISHEGVEDLVGTLADTLELLGLAHIVGVVIDADESTANRWASIRSQLQRAGYPDVPLAPEAGGVVLDPPVDSLLPRVGIWLMPDNSSRGILEDFLRLLVPPGSALYGHVERSVADIPPGEVMFPGVAKPKALIHTWLAWQQEPGKPLGQAIMARYLDPHSSSADAFAAWLRRLFFPES